MMGHGCSTVKVIHRRPLQQSLPHEKKKRSAPPKKRSCDVVVVVVPRYAPHDVQSVMVPTGSSGHSLTRLGVCRILGSMLTVRFCADGILIKSWIRDHLVPVDASQFESKTGCPEISLIDYLERITQYSYISGESIIIGIWRILQIQRMWPTFPINLLTIHRLILVSLMISAKFFDDTFVNNAVYSKIGGIAKDELNRLEIEFLKCFNFSVGVTGDQYKEAYHQLIIKHQQNLTVPI